jgi:hypothetical protein
VEGLSVSDVVKKVMENGRSLEPWLPQFLQRAEALDSAGRKSLLGELEALLDDYAPEKAWPLAILAGAVVEIGADPKDFPPAVFNELAEMLAEVPPAAPEGDEEADEDPFELPEHFYPYEQAAMACLSRSAELRRTLPQKPLMLSRIHRYSERYGFLGKMLSVLDDEPALVVDAPTGRIWRCRLSGIADNFQLHTLVLGAFAGGLIKGDALTKELVASQASGPPVASATISSRWQLASWPALRDAKFAEQSNTAHWIWNEGVPADIAVFEGQRVIAIAPATMTRSWGAQRVFQGMAGRLAVETQLPGGEAAELLGRMMSAPIP